MFTLYALVTLLTFGFLLLLVSTYLSKRNLEVKRKSNVIGFYIENWLDTQTGEVIQVYGPTDMYTEDVLNIIEPNRYQYIGIDKAGA